MARNGTSAARHEVPPISFRLDDYHFELVKTLAAKEGVSPGQFARKLTIEAVTNGIRLLEAVHQLRQEFHEALERLNDNVKTSTIGLLADAGQTSLAEAEAWVKENLERV